jgi:DNA gyrase/topoisomerase IV subunit A
MSENNNFALVLRPPSSVEKAEAGPKRIVSRMVSETLALARKTGGALDVGGAKTELREWLEWHLKAAQRGSPESLYQLGVAFLGGDRVLRDSVEGYKWLFLAGCQGHSKACEYFDEAFDYSDESFDEARRRSAEFEETYNILAPAPDERGISSLAVTFAVTHSGIIKRVKGNFPQAQRGFSNWVAGIDSRNGAASRDFVEHVFIAKPHDHLMFFTDTGRVYDRFTSEIPEGSAIHEGCALTGFLGLGAGEIVVALVCVPSRTGPNNEDTTWRQHGFLFFTTQQGTVKKAPLEDFADARKVWAKANGMIAIGIEPEDSLAGVQFTAGQDQIVMVTRNGMSIRFSEEDVRLMGRPAGGVRGIKLEQGDTVVAAPKVVHNAMLLLVAQNGIGGRRPFDEYRLQLRGGKGEVTMKNGGVAAALAVYGDDEIMFCSAAGQRLRKRVSNIPVRTEVKLVNLERNDKLQAIGRVMDEGHEAEQ